MLGARIQRAEQMIVEPGLCCVALTSPIVLSLHAPNKVRDNKGTGKTEDRQRETECRRKKDATTQSEGKLWETDRRPTLVIGSLQRNKKDKTVRNETGFVENKSRSKERFSSFLR